MRKGEIQDILHVGQKLMDFVNGALFRDVGNSVVFLGDDGLGPRQLSGGFVVAFLVPEEIGEETERTDEVRAVITGRTFYDCVAKALESKLFIVAKQVR